MSRGEFNYHFTEINTTTTATFDDDCVRFSERDFRDIQDKKLFHTSVDRDQQTWAPDFWRIARAAYLADRRSPRSQSRDHWRRTIRLSVQVCEPDCWKSQLGRLGSLLQLLTGDRWEMDVHDGAPSSLKLLNPVDHPPRMVALFSGGLDSSAYAAHRAAHLGESERLMFLAFDPTAQLTQKEVFEDIKNLAPQPNLSLDRLSLEQIRLIPRGPLDRTNRSRSLLYLAAAICLAAGENVHEVVVPENGQLAINPPLTPARRAACSTRSVHPWVIATVNELIAEVGSDITVRNPFLRATKGDVCRCALSAGLAPEVLQRTISCGRPVTARSQSNRTHFNCGTCFPCLVRRSGLHSALGIPDGTGYAHALSSLDLTDTERKSREATAHLRDLIRWVDTPFTIDDLIADTPYPPTTPPQSVMPVLERGRDELTAMLADLVPDLYPVRLP